MTIASNLSAISVHPPDSGGNITIPGPDENLPFGMPARRFAALSAGGSRCLGLSCPRFLLEIGVGEHQIDHRAPSRIGTDRRNASELLAKGLDQPDADAFADFVHRKADPVIGD